MELKFQTILDLGSVLGLFVIYAYIGSEFVGKIEKFIFKKRTRYYFVAAFVYYGPAEMSLAYSGYILIKKTAHFNFNDARVGLMNAHEKSTNVLINGYKEISKGEYLLNK